MPQRAIRFPQDVHDAIEAEARRMGHPNTFSSIVVNTMRAALSSSETPEHKLPIDMGDVPEEPIKFHNVPAPKSKRVQRGSASPSLERFSKAQRKGGKA